MCEQNCFDLDRRAFIKTVGVGLGSVAAFSAADLAQAQSIAEASEGISPSDLNWGKAPCRYCGTGCGVEVGVKDGKVLAVRGDEASPVNRGLLCVKGYHLPAMLYGKDRLLHPQRRKADGSLEQISWEQALDLIAEKFGSALKEHGPESVAVYGSGQWTIFDGYAALKWTKGGMRSNNLDPNARLCMASAVMAFMQPVPRATSPWAATMTSSSGDDFIMWGNNMAEMHPVLFSRMLERKRRKTRQVRIIDHGHASHCPLPITPTSIWSSSPARTSPWAMRILYIYCIEKGLVERKHSSKRTVIFKRGIEDIEEDRLRLLRRSSQASTASRTKRSASSLDEDLKQPFVKDYTPAKGLRRSPAFLLSNRSGISGGDLWRPVKRGAVSLWCMGVNQHVRGTWMNETSSTASAPHHGQDQPSPGSNPFSLTGQPSACGTAREVGTLSNVRLPADMLVMKEAAPQTRQRRSGSCKPRARSIGQARLPRRRYVPRANPRRYQGHVDSGHQPLGLHAQPESFQDSNPATADSSWSAISTPHPRRTCCRSNPPLLGMGGARRRLRQYSERRTQHWNKMVESAPASAKEDALANRPGRQAYGNGTISSPGRRNHWHEAMYEEYREFHPRHGQGPRCPTKIAQARPAAFDGRS